MFRPAPYCPATGVVNIARSAVLRNSTVEPPFTTLPIAVGSPVKLALLFAPTTAVCRPELTVNGKPLDQSMIVFVDQPPMTRDRMPVFRNGLPGPNGSS